MQEKKTSKVAFLGSGLAALFPSFLRDGSEQNEYLAEEESALNFLVAKDDVMKYWNESSSISGYGSSWLLFPDGNGTAKIAIIKDDTGALMSGIYDEEEANEKVKFHLYTSQNLEGVPFTLSTAENIVLNKTDGVKIICHGWRSNGNSDIIQNIKDAYLAEQNVSVIGVDWSYAAHNIFYNHCARQTLPVGRTVGTLIDKLAKTFSIPYEDFHVIGHSLGAHVAGFAGRHTKSKVGRITGLDPALPGFQFLIVAGGRLDKEDAVFVDVIHSCASSLGMSVPVGHVDFYPNGGSPLQPGCIRTIPGSFTPGINTVACSHIRSYQLFEQSIRKGSDFTAVKCKSWEKFLFHECLDSFTQMGDRVNRNSTGTYYLKTEGESPYYLGEKGVVF